LHSPCCWSHCYHHTPLLPLRYKIPPPTRVALKICKCTRATHSLIELLNMCARSEEQKAQATCVKQNYQGIQTMNNFRVLSRHYHNHVCAFRWSQHECSTLFTTLMIGRSSTSTCTTYHKAPHTRSWNSDNYVHSTKTAHINNTRTSTGNRSTISTKRFCKHTHTHTPHTQAMQHVADRTETASQLAHKGVLPTTCSFFPADFSK